MNFVVCKSLIHNHTSQFKFWAMYIKGRVLNLASQNEGGYFGSQCGQLILVMHVTYVFRHIMDYYKDIER